MTVLGHYPDDGIDVYQMTQSLSEKENNCKNRFFGLSYTEFKQKLSSDDAESRYTEVVDGVAPHTIYWLYCDDFPVGFSNLRHELTEKSRKQGGNIGYAISPEYRGKGFGKEILKLTLDEARKKGLDKVLLTTKVYNHMSRKIIEFNSGVLEKEVEGTCYYWINL